MRTIPAAARDAGARAEHARGHQHETPYDELGNGSKRQYIAAAEAVLIAATRTMKCPECEGAGAFTFDGDDDLPDTSVRCCVCSGTGWLFVLKTEA